ncbi:MULTISPECIES: DUF488 domain-containing protein [Enterobacteriaceae]|uniref:DUF488 domain-containing protein n=1 Tax=Enterobacteriaceae TaxID=543 RepID=UPI00066862AF|nr:MULTISPECIES: DUF488 domain-containing protein [Enterobacteriaceae]EDR6733878.1 DUF488 domain-containing protein [Salmonella enterica subsp. enterica]HBR3944700.1 DUF488 domain-containing protein [Klebsiella pneumoniae]NTY82040.1 DUF488 domain-containing protein [Citrobacter werkmanii]PXM15607.1 DUF488 domain-containing protein [Klebsiella variicola]HDZ1026230.1 DUF488 domain-containing protein [Klebsiella pneumoniae]
MNVYTIGFTKTTAEIFFTKLKINNVKTLIDVRLNNSSQLAGFAKAKDLEFFLSELCNIKYMHILEFAPTKEILKPYQNKDISWSDYADKFMNLMAKRNIERYASSLELEGGCLLCSEHEPHHCHRRLVLEYLKSHALSDIKEKHL